MNQNHILPELKGGETVELGARVKLLRTRERDAFGAPLFRLRHAGGMRDGYYVPPITGNQRFSREDLQRLGARLVEE